MLQNAVCKILGSVWNGPDKVGRVTLSWHTLSINPRSRFEFQSLGYRGGGGAGNFMDIDQLQLQGTPEMKS